MRSFILASLAGLAVAAPAAMPQDSFDWDIIDAAVEPSATGAPMGVVTSTSSLDIASVNAAATSAASSAYSEALANPVTTTGLSSAAATSTVDSAATSTVPNSAAETASSIEKRDGTCAKQPSGSGPKTTPDNAAAFLANPIYNVSHLIHIACFNTKYHAISLPQSLLALLLDTLWPSAPTREPHPPVSTLGTTL